MRRSWLALVLVAVVIGIPVSAEARVGDRAATVLDDRDLTRTGTWTSKSASAAYLGTLSKSKAKGSRLVSPQATVGGGSVVFQFGPDRGKAQVVVGGLLKKTVKTAANKKKLKVVSFTGDGVVSIKVKKPGKGVFVDKVTLSGVPGPPAPAAGEVILTEWLSNPDTITEVNGEWFELHNVSAGTRTLTGCTVANQSAASSTLPAATVPAGGTFLLARNGNAADNGGLAEDAVFSFALTTNGSLTLTCATTVIDTVAWTGETSGQTTQLDPDHYTSTENDIAVNYCVGTTPYGTSVDLGTPDALNVQCP